MRKLSLLLLCTTPFFLTGCGVLRNIEQWKCDNMGMCHFGITPSMPYSQPWESGVYPPASTYDGAVLSGPFAGDVYTQSEPHAHGGQNCENCRK